jgi:hypothetical protein
MERKSSTHKGNRNYNGILVWKIEEWKHIKDRGKTENILFKRS